MADYETIKTQKDGAIFTITLNRPERMNAFTYKMHEELIAAFDEADADDEVRAVIMTGEGKAYCAGADLEGGGKIFDSSGRETVQEHRDSGGLVTLRIFECKKLVIAAINGAAVGVGITMCLPADIRLASEKAKFGFVFCRRGLVPEACSSWFLPRIAGISKAMEWVATGRVFLADEALANGLVSEVLPPEKLLERAREIANESAENTSGVAVAMARHLLWRMMGADHPMEAHKLDSKCIAYMGQNADVKEGVTSFLEKRAPKYPMKVSTDMPDFFPFGKERKFSE
ncbi:MAG: crotonase/enoyl-CoA hydratase family protein [Chrysiogenetes bacterium]|nr:crotonase/enoyl-CoA hydratase family protein [Chrysiogenetes bacterium]